jgi:AraC-like DNA-binding protein
MWGAIICLIRVICVLENAISTAPLPPRRAEGYNSPAMDPLSDLLRVVRLDGAFFYAVEAGTPWCVETVAARELSPRIMPAAEHLISYHILTDGTCYGGLVGEEPVELVAGDVIVFPHGDAHVMSSGWDGRISPDVSNAAPERYPFKLIHGGAGPPSSSFLCGFLGCDRRPFNPLLAALPRRMHMRGISSAWLGNFVGQITEESRLGRSGAEGVLTRLAELMFIELLRRYLEDLPPGQTGWLAGLRDELVGRVLTLLHARPGHPWTLPDLAREAAASRSSVARRFALLVGQPPMQYLAQWRMQVAANLLVQSGAKIAAIGAEVGYDSEAAFSRAFKKATGLAPGAWRSGRLATPP